MTREELTLKAISTYNGNLHSGMTAALGAVVDMVLEEAARVPDEVREAFTLAWINRPTREAIAAALNAWPGMTMLGPHSSGHGRSEPALILPLTETPMPTDITYMARVWRVFGMPKLGEVANDD